jgi:hypothetical protein
MTEAAKASMISTSSSAIPEPVREVLQAMSEIRRLVLTESPQLLPRLAPFMVKAEHGVDTLWVR